jgi:hypothetical protein
LGLQNLTAGEKNPLAEYNGAFKRLQKRRNMNAVTLTVLEEPSKPAAHPSAPSAPPGPSERPEPGIPSAVAADDEHSDVPEETNEVEQSLNDAERRVVGETLPRLTEDDVAYDMDEVFIEESTDIDTDESDTSNESEIDVYWEEEG